MLTDPLLLRRGPADPRALRRGGGFPAARALDAAPRDAGRNQNVLSHELQEATAEILGYPGAEPRQRVERLMSDYFRHARIVSRSLEWARRRRRRCRSAPNLGLSRDGIRFIDPAGRRAIRRRGSRAFQAAIDAGTAKSPKRRSRASSSTSSGYRADDFFPTPRAPRRRCCAFCSRGPGCTRGSRRCTTAACSGGCFREFQAISWRVVRDFYHKYTVDEHTLLTIRNLERLATRTAPDRERFRSLLAGPRRRPSCSCWRCCCTTSASGATTITRSRACAWREDMFDRLQLSAEQRATVLFLIRHHLRMSLVAFRRDTEDPDIVRQFAALVGTEERLKMLCLMTLVDVEAVSPETLTPWKEELLWRLYVDTYNHLTQRLRRRADRAEPGGPHASCWRTGPADLSRERDHAFPRGAAAALPAALPREAIYRHVRLARDIKPDEVHLVARAERRDLGARPWSRSTSRFCSRTSAACCRRSAWTSCAATR